MVDSDPEFARVVKGRIEKTTLGEVHTVYYTSVFYMWFFYLNKMEIYDQVDWNNGICNKNLRSFDVRKLRIRHADVLIIFY